jgi:predicted flap endonuclease-1-like 5' DNA nuclease
MDVYTTILACIAVLLTVLLYILYQSVRGLRKPVEPSKPETITPVETQEPNVEATVEFSGLAAGEARAPEPNVEAATALDETETVEPVLKASETIETQRPGWNIKDIEGIGPTYTEKLYSLEIKTTADLLEAGSTPRGREELAEKTGIPPKLILEWINLSDLLRIKGVAEEYSDLLEEAGVKTVPELSTRNPENLHAKMIKINEEKRLVRRTMSQEQVRNWIEYAKKLPRKVEY